jgi:hypothetical protein
MSEPTKFEGWAVVEIMGHVRVAGQVREETVFGQAMIRVDVPAIDGHPAFTRYYHPQALYSLCPTDETTARHVAQHQRHPPIERWQLPQVKPAAPASGHTGDDDQDDVFDDDSEF